jgi:hypothetical protein
MRRPPSSIAYVARTHWTVGSVILVSVALLHWVTNDLPGVEFRLRTYQITLGLGVLYLLAGTLVWLGAPLGRVCSRVCSLLYLARPSFGLGIWETMNRPDFAAHFRRGAEPPES